MIQAPELTRVRLSNLFWLTEAQMERLKPFFPKRSLRTQAAGR